MYDYIKGQYVSKNASAKGNYVTLEAGNIGFSLEVMERDIKELKSLNDEIKLYTVLIHREDKMSLCGFLKREDRDVFNILTSVSGVGVKMALTLLNSFHVYDLTGFVLSENYKELTRAKGVGPKLAQKIILELKDKLTKFEGECSIPQTKVTKLKNLEDAQTVLLSLGYSESEITDAVSKIGGELDLDASAEIILKAALKTLSI